MTLNRRSIKWLPKVSLIIALVLLTALVIFKATAGSPEMDMLNSMERANSIQVYLVDLLFK